METSKGTRRLAQNTGTCTRARVLLVTPKRAEAASKERKTQTESGVPGVQAGAGGTLGGQTPAPRTGLFRFKWFILNLEDVAPTCALDDAFKCQSDRAKPFPGPGGASVRPEFPYSLVKFHLTKKDSRKDENGSQKKTV